jgi:[NiFe] hydrogenase diaphorase moiety large subunit
MNAIERGRLTFADIVPNAGLEASMGSDRAQVLHELKESGLRGRGGAGFPTSVKWNLAAAANDPDKYIVCNADEGEPGTFKDRVILTEHPDLVMEGMTIGARVIGARRGYIYLRAEYSYLRPHLEGVLDQRRNDGLLGERILDSDLSFDIEIRMGAGAYICGEETALIESLEGHRGEPRNRPPFPVDTGFQGHPTIVNNVETLAWVTCILARGATWFRSLGVAGSAGLKLMSVSGDCARPGVYEFPLGITVRELLDVVEGADAKAVQIGGAAGQCVPASEFERRISFKDVPTGGSVIVFGHAARRRELPGVFRRRVLWSVHAVPLRQREAPRRGAQAPGGEVLDVLLEGDLLARRDDADRLQVRAGAIEPERLPVDRQTLYERDHGTSGRAQLSAPPPFPGERP